MYIERLSFQTMSCDPVIAAFVATANIGFGQLKTAFVLEDIGQSDADKVRELVINACGVYAVWYDNNSLVIVPTSAREEYERCFTKLPD